MTCLLDTNAWLWSVNEPAALPEPVRALLESEGPRFGLSIISVWEVAKKHQIGRLGLSVPLDEWLDKALTTAIDLLPLTPGIITSAMDLPAFINNDPADELIVATARHHDLLLVTSDRKLRGYKHARVHYFKPRSE